MISNPHDLAAHAGAFDHPAGTLEVLGVDRRQVFGERRAEVPGAGEARHLREQLALLAQVVRPKRLVHFERGVGSLKKASWATPTPPNDQFFA